MNLIFSKISKNFDFGQNFRKISILMKLWKNFYFGEFFEKFSMLLIRFY